MRLDTKLFKCEMADMVRKKGESKTAIVKRMVNAY